MSQWGRLELPGSIRRERMTGRIAMGLVLLSSKLAQGGTNTAPWTISHEGRVLRSLLACRHMHSSVAMGITSMEIAGTRGIG